MRYLIITFLFASMFPLAASAAPDESKGDDADMKAGIDRAQLLFRKGKDDDAIAEASKLVKAYPAKEQPLLLRGSLFEAVGKYDAAISDVSAAIKIKSKPAYYQRRGVLHFNASRFKASVKDFDQFLKSYPDQAPHHWQRGISHYYAKMYKEGVAQFEIHKKVNPEDVENAIWHYLCKAKVDGLKKAREGLIPIKADTRPWADSAYRLFQGNLKPEAMLKAMTTDAEAANNPRTKDYILFYTHLYIGLFYEAEGDAKLAKKHILLAANKYPSTHYMGDVARVHAKLFESKKAKPSTDKP